jgi:hypothetical protein
MILKLNLLQNIIFGYTKINENETLNTKSLTSQMATIQVIKTLQL